MVSWLPVIGAVQAKAVFRKRGLVFAPHAATLAGSGIVSGLALATNPLGAKENIHDRVAEQMSMVYSDVKATATEFNARGDYGAGIPFLGDENLNIQDGAGMLWLQMFMCL